MDHNNNHGMLCYRITEFCRNARICRTKLYELFKTGQGPKTIKIGRRRLILIDSGQQWLRKLEADTPIRTQGEIQHDIQGDRP
jgi:predicted DNA-binding transcriptional regulator AlpA